MADEEAPSRAPLLILAGIMGASALLAGRVLLRGSGKPVPLKPAPVRRATRAWPEEDAPRIQDPQMLTQPQGSSLEMVTRPAEAAKQGSVALEQPQAAPGAAQDPAAAAANAAWRSGASSAGLSEAEKAQLARLAGRDLTDPKKAADVAGADGLWSSVMKTLSRHPRLMGYLLNSETVVGAFMGRETSRRYCQSEGAYKSYLTDLKSPNGVTHAMNVFDTMMHGSQEMPTVMFSSRMADAMLRCPSVQAISNDPAAVREIAIANPRAIQLVNDPAIMAGLAANPAAMTAFQAAQSNLGH